MLPKYDLGIRRAINVPLIQISGFFIEKNQPQELKRLVAVLYIYNALSYGGLPVVIDGVLVPEDWEPRGDFTVTLLFRTMHQVNVFARFVTGRAHL